MITTVVCLLVIGFCFGHAVGTRHARDLMRLSAYRCEMWVVNDHVLPHGPAPRAFPTITIKKP